MEISNSIYVTSRKAWRSWLSKNHEKKSEIWLIYYRKASGKPRIPYDDAVEEALCYGWIDSTLKSIDEEKFAQRFSPRRKGSKLSQLNLERIRKLISKKKMTRKGLAAVAHVFDPLTDIPAGMKVARDILRVIQSNKDAWENFKRLPDSYIRVRIAYIEHRRHNPTLFNKTLKYFVKMTAQNKRFGSQVE